MTTNQTVAALRVQAKSLGITGYSKLIKSDLLEIVLNARDTKTINIKEISEPVVIAPITESKALITIAKPFVLTGVAKSLVAKYESFKLYESLRGVAVMNGQYNILQSLEINFKCSIDTSKLLTAGEASDKITKVLNAIKSGVLQARDTEQVTLRLSGYKAYADCDYKNTANLVKQEVAVSTQESSKYTRLDAVKDFFKKFTI